MLRKIINYLGIVLLTLSADQCFNKCQVRPVYDTTNLHLKWQETSKPLDISGIDLSKAADGKVYYVPAHKASYFIDLQGNTWKFTQPTEGDLQVKNIGNLGTTFNPNEAFIFTAGTTEQQALFIGKIANKAGGGAIQLWKCEGDTWQALPQSSSSISSLFTDAQDWKTTVASCSWQDQEQVHGCVLIPLQETGGNFDTGVLSFDATTGKFTSFQNTLVRTPTQTPNIAISPVPGKMIVQYTQPDGDDKFAIVDITENQLTVVQKEIKNVYNYQATGAFLLQLEGEFPVLDPIFYMLDNEGYKFLRLDGNNNLVPADNPSKLVFGQGTLLVPFNQNLYCIITQISDEGETKTVFYQAELAMNPNKPKPVVTPTPTP